MYTNMQRMESRRVSFSLDVNEKFPEVSFMPASIKKTRMPSRNKIGSSSSTAKMFQCVRTNVAKAIRLVSKKSASVKKNSSISNVVVPDQHQYFVPHRDSHHFEAMDDCIEFVNSSYRKST